MTTERKTGTLHRVSIAPERAQSSAILLAVSATDTVVFSGLSSAAPTHLRVVKDGVAMDAIHVPAPSITTGLWSIGVDASLLNSTPNAVRVVIECRFAPEPVAPAQSETAPKPYRDAPPESEWKPCATLIVISSTRKTATNLALAPSAFLALIAAIQLAPIYRISSPGTVRNTASVLASAAIVVAARVLFRTSFRWWNHSIAYTLLGSILCLTCFLHKHAETRALIVFSANATVARHFGPVGGVAYTTQSELAALLPQIRAEGASVLPNEMVHQCEMPMTPGYQAARAQSIACDDRWLMLAERIQLAMGIHQTRERSTGCVDVTGPRCRAPLTFHEHEGHAAQIPWTIPLQVPSQRESQTLGVIFRPSVHGQLQFYRTLVGLDEQRTRLVHFHVQNTSSLRVDRAEQPHSDFMFNWQIATPPATTRPMLTEFALHAILAPGTPLLRLHSGSTAIEVACERSEDLDVVLTDIDPTVIAAIKVGDQPRVVIAPEQRQLALCAAHEGQRPMQIWLRQEIARVCDRPAAREAISNTWVLRTAERLQLFAGFPESASTSQHLISDSLCSGEQGFPMRLLAGYPQALQPSQRLGDEPTERQLARQRQSNRHREDCEVLCVGTIQPGGTSVHVDF